MEGRVASSVAVWPPLAYVLVTPRVGLKRGRGEALRVLGSLCVTVLNGFIMQSSRHQGDGWSHNGTRANIIQVFSQRKLIPGQKAGEEREI